MKKLFNMFTQPKEEATVSTAEIVEQIHHEFYTAADKLLEEARNIIASTDQRSVDKSTRLHALGFHSAREVEKYRETKMQMEMSKETIELIEFYNKKFPDYKFITSEQAKQICEKYNLYIASTTKYKGFVPEKNLAEIERFVEKYNTLNNLWLQTREGELLILEDAELFYDSGYYHIRKKGTTGKYPERAFQSDGDMARRGIYGSDSHNIFGLRHMGHISAKQVPTSFQIAAPIQDLDLENTQIKDRTVSEILSFPDPVVLNPVKGGYIIITAWGDEAEDPIIKG